METKSTKIKEIQRNWHLIDVENVVLGRIAVTISYLLRGKGKPYFVEHLDCGDYVVVVNAQKVKVTGSKELNKTYSSYSGYPGGLKVQTLAKVREKYPEKIVRHAVGGMLPKNKLRKQWLTRLYIYKDAKHPYGNKFNTK